MTTLHGNWGQLMKDEKQIESFLETQQAMRVERDRMVTEGIADYLHEMTSLYGDQVVEKAIRIYQGD